MKKPSKMSKKNENTVKNVEKQRGNQQKYRRMIKIFEKPGKN